MTTRPPWPGTETPEPDRQTLLLDLEDSILPTISPGSAYLAAIADHPERPDLVMVDGIPQVPATPGELGLAFPAWRSNQREIIQDILYWYFKRDEKVLMLEAPTGVGKSLIAAALARILSHPMLQHHTAVTTISRHLQSQYTETLPGDLSAVAWGRSNHQCLIVHEGDPSDAPCTYGYRCPEKARCPYYVERDTAQVHPTSILNTAFYLTGLQFVRLPKEPPPVRTSRTHC
jgi:hypothetical protein